MQRMFDADRAILAEDYEHFAGVKITTHVPTRRCKGHHTSAAQSGPKAQGQS